MSPPPTEQVPPAAALRLLLVADSERDAGTVVGVLEQAGFTVQRRRVATAEGLREALGSQAWDVLISDYQLAALDAPGALAILRGSGLDIPFIVVSGTAGEEAAVAMMRAGAHDYLLRGSLVRLPPVVSRELEEASVRRARRQVEAELLDSKQFAQSTLDGLNLHICVIDEKGVILATNDAWRAFAEANGAAPGQPAVGTNYLAACGQGEGSAFAEALREVLAGGSGGFEMEIGCGAGGEERWYLARVARLVSGGPGRIVISHEDVTESKQADERLRLVSLAVENSPVSVVITDAGGAIQYVNPHFKDLTGYSAEEVLGRNPRILKSGMMPAAVFTQLWETITSGKVWKGNLHNRKKDGEFFWEHATIAPIHDKQGRIVRYVAVKEDITERLRLARDLEEREATLRAFFDGSPMLMGIAEVTGRDEIILLSANQAAAKFFGRSVEHLRGRNLRQSAIDSQEYALWLTRLREAETAGVPIHFLMGGRDPGQDQWLSVTVAPLPQAGGGHPRFCFIAQDITETFLAQQALQQSESRLEEAQRLAHLGSFTRDLRSGEAIWSDELCRIFGIEPGGPCPSYGEFLRMVHPEDRPDLQATVERAIRDSASFKGEFRILKPDGEVRTVLLHAEALAAPDGGPGHLMGACLDITDREQAKRALQESEMRYRLISENMRDLICLHHPDGTYAYVSPSVRDMLGYEPEELVGTSPYRLFHLRDVEAIRASGQTRDRPGSAVQYRIRKKDGAYLWVETITQPILGPGGEVVKLQTATRDVTEHVAQQEELYRQNEVFRLAQRATNDAIWDWDILTGHMERGTAIQSLFGFTKEAPPPRISWWFDHIHPEDRERVKAGFDEVLDGEGTVWSDQYRFQRGDGSFATVLDRGYVVRDPEGYPLRMVGAMVDLSDRILMEEAQAANRAKSEFLATMTHELRTPMIGMLGMVEILSHTGLDADQRRSLDTIQSSARSLLEIIGNILDFSKIESGRLELDPQAVALEALCREECAQYSGAASGKGLKLSCELDSRLAKAHHVDPLRLREILGNFFSNSLKFTQQGSVGLRVEVLDSGAEGQTLAFRVWDTGIGVSKENLSRLFQPFVQAESNTTRRFGGTGLGLSISRRLAEMMGGEIIMESAVGEGTTMSFVVTLPLAELEVPEMGPEAGWAPLQAPDRDEAEAAGSLILLAEDHPTNRLVLQKQLQLAGYQSDVAEDGVEAYEAWLQHRYALVLTDVHMPRMDGYELAREIRNAEQAAGHGARIPILALTANALQGELERCLAAGMDDCIIKPIAIPALHGKLQRWLPLAGPRSGAEVAPGEALAAPEAETGMPVVDLAVLKGITGGDVAAALDVLQDFRESVRQDLAELKALAERGNLDLVTRQAHRIKGASLMVGAVALAESAKTLEKSARSSAPDEIQARLDELESTFGAVEAFTDAQTGKSRPGPP
jgi:PAS domain S-box-containing protein